MPEIHFAKVTKTYSGSSTPAVRELDLTIPDGEFLCLLGPSGCGKTTSLRMLAGLESLSGGSISIGDNVVDDVQRGVFVPTESRNLGMVFQSYALWPHLSVRENVRFGLAIKKVPPHEQKTLLAQALATLGIEKYADRYPAELSGGQQQRVALARTLVTKPSVILMDEPLSNLDAKLRLEMRAELKRIHDTSAATFAFVTHDQWEAMTLATRIAVMRDGSLQQVGSPSSIYDDPANLFVAEFVGSPPINVVSPDQENELIVQFFSLDPTGRAHHAALRPEAIVLEPGSGAELDGGPANRPTASDRYLEWGGLVTSIMPTGGSWIVEFLSFGQRMIATSSAPPPFGEGAPVHARVERRQVLVFNKEGDRIRL